MNRKHSVLARITLVTSVILFIVALTQPCYCTAQECGEPFEGLLLLVVGVFGLFSFPAGVTWLANLTIFIAWRSFKNPKRALIWSAIGLGIALSFMLFKQVMVNEAGGISNVTQYQLGYYLWVASFVGMLASSFISYRQSQPLQSLPLIRTYPKPTPEEQMINGEWTYNGQMEANENANRIDWLTRNYFIKVETTDGGWTTKYQDPEDKRYWVRTYPKGEMHGGGPPLLYCVSETRGDLYKAMTVNERLYVSGLMSSFETAVEKNDANAVIAILRKVDLTEGNIDPILESYGLKRT